MDSNGVAVTEPTVAAAVDGFAAAAETLFDAHWDATSTAERMRVLVRLTEIVRRIPALQHRLIADVRRDATSAELGGGLRDVLADRCRITRAAAARAITEAQDLGPRTALNGEPLEPRLAATAAQVRAGTISDAHIRVIRGFLAGLPTWIETATRERAEADLADLATRFRPDELHRAADRMALALNPDGDFSDADRARRRGFSWSAQDTAGMSTGRLTATPELRASLDAWLAKYAAPGRCNPADETPTVDDDPTSETADGDRRTPAQRRHDALCALVRGQLGDPALGSHNGLPVTIIASTTVQQLQTAAGHATTAGATLLPMPDLIRMAGNAIHYLAIFDEHTHRPLYLGKTKRLATADQRIVLHATDRGCTYPGCDKPGYLCEVHHVDQWATGDGQTNIDRLTFACKPHHRLLDTGWTAEKTPTGKTRWIPPPQLELPGGINNYHHPDRYLHPGDPDDDAP